MYKFCFFAAIRNLRRLIGEHVFYTPLPHFFLDGCADEATIRAAVEVAAWANIYFGRERLLLRQTFVVANEILIEPGTGMSPMLASNKLMLPIGSNGGTVTWTSSNVSGLPAAVRPAGMRQEKLLYSAMAAELRAGLAIDVEEEPSFDRAVGDKPVTAGRVRYLVVGCSSAQRLHRALQEKGIAADLIHLANLRILRGTGEMLAEKITAAVRKLRLAAIILQLLDNTVFEALTKDGDKLPPRRQGDKFHLDGDITVADRNVVGKLLKMCRPALEATDGVPTVMVGPLPRYITGGCCEDPQHMGNRKKPDFLHEMKRDLAALNKSIKDFLFNNDFPTIRAMDPWVGLKTSRRNRSGGATPSTSSRSTTRSWWVVS
jgi:hypothetical protein